MSTDKQRASNSPGDPERRVTKSTYQMASLSAKPGDGDIEGSTWQGAEASQRAVCGSQAHTRDKDRGWGQPSPPCRALTAPLGTERRAGVLQTGGVGAHGSHRTPGPQREATGTNGWGGSATPEPNRVSTSKGEHAHVCAHVCLSYRS